MAPVATETLPAQLQASKKTAPTTTSYPKPLKLTGILDQYESFEVTPAIGREYPHLQIKDLLDAPNSDELLRELAIITSRRGVVFFRAQDLTPAEQKDFTDRVAALAGRPQENGLHIHPILNSERDADQIPLDRDGNVNKDDTISIISSKLRRAVYNDLDKPGIDEWHSDISFEPNPADYTTLKVHSLPHTGGDTLFASSYELYDLLSEPFKKLADGLTAHFAQPGFNKAAEKGGFRIHPGPRGSPHNVGEVLETRNPLVRTNPVTGWRSIIAGHHLANIEGLRRREGELLQAYLLELITTSHAAQARFKWGANDLVLFDNRCTHHAATPDFLGFGDRAALRVVSAGEKPYFDPNSISRREELGGSKLI